MAYVLFHGPYEGECTGGRGIERYGVRRIPLREVSMGVDMACDRAGINPLMCAAITAGDNNHTMHERSFYFSRVPHGVG